MITNVQYEQRVYNHKKMDVDRDLYSDTDGGAPKELVENFDNLAASAQKMLKSRKPHYDFKTRNKSFLELYSDLYKLGVKNNKFFLRIYDTSLIGVDPYAPKLPLDIQLRIFLECLINPWYFLREIARIPEDGAPIEVGGGTQYRIDRNNLACWYLFLNGIPFYQSKPRQRGKTQDCLCRFNYAYHFAAMSSSFLFFSKDLPLAKQNLYRMKCQRDMMPTYLQMKFIITEDGKYDKGRDNITTMQNPVTHNTVTVMPKATSQDTAIRLGRGATAAFQYYDEFDFISYIKDIINTAAFAFSKASENAAKNGSLFSRTLSSTPGDIDHRDGKFAAEFIDKMVRWEEKYFDLPINQLKKILKSPKLNGFVFVEHSWKQLKCSMEWYEEQCKLVNYDEETIAREIDLKRISGSGLSPFRRADIMYINNHIKEPIDQIDYSKNLCPIYIYRKLNRKIHYLLCVDPAEGLAQDNTGLSLINPYTRAVDAEFKSPFITQTDMGKLIVKFMDEYCPKSMIVVEANKGRELINYLIDSKYRYQLYYDVDKLNAKIVDDIDEYGAAKRAAYMRRAYGVDTTKSSRKVMFGILEALMEEEKQILYTKYVVKDISALERKPSGKIAAAEGAHDDNIMSYLIGLFVYNNASNLEEFGIRKGAKSPEEDEIDPNSPEAKKAAIQNILPYLDGDLKKLFMESITERSEASDIKEHQREIQAIINANDSSNDVIDVNSESFYDMDMARSEILANSVFDSNFIREDDYKVDIDSLI